jgi:hypothetical protein
LACGFQSVHLRHFQIHYSNARANLGSQLHGFSSGGRFGAHVPSFMRFQHRAQTLADDIMIIG